MCKYILNVLPTINNEPFESFREDEEIHFPPTKIEIEKRNYTLYTAGGIFFLACVVFMGWLLELSLTTKAPPPPAPGILEAVMQIIFYIVKVIFKMITVPVRITLEYIVIVLLIIMFLAIYIIQLVVQLTQMGIQRQMDDTHINLIIFEMYTHFYKYFTLANYK